MEELHTEKESKRPQGDQPTVRYYEDLYKYRGKCKSSQEERRKCFLEDMRLRRIRNVQENRCPVVELSDEQEMDVEHIKTSRHRKVCISKYANLVMLSESFSEVPSDLENSWLCKLCPIGARRLVLAANRQTIAFNKHGIIKDWFSSRLPCGNRRPNNSGKKTLLDCVYNHELKCYFVLDVLIWNGINLQEGETDFRFFFVKSRLDDEPKLTEIDKENHRRFVNVDYFSFSSDLIEERMGLEYIIDKKLVTIFGILFYHKETSYIAGENPLVCWIKPHLLPALFQISIPDVYLNHTVKKEIENVKDLEIEEFCKMEL